jgi:pyruvate formate lyase activating enzyme
MDQQPAASGVELGHPAFDATTTVELPLITEIQRFSVQDGPGIRTTIFLKGCPLKCPWCHNPETQNSAQEVYYHPSRCVACGRCAEICPSGACSLAKRDDGRQILDFDRTDCQRCMKCVAVCLTDARETTGQEMTMDEILREALSDKLFYRNSGGGVTVSGGDPLLYPAFLGELARRLKAEGVHVAIETSCFPKRWSDIEPLLSCIDLFIVDLKSLNPDKHLKVIGWPLDIIMGNIDRLIKSKARVRIHLPIIPGFNDSADDFEKYAQFLGQYAESLDGVDILNYHCYGEGKYGALGRGETYAYKGVNENAPELLLPLAAGLKAAGITNVTIGGLVGIGGRRD